MKDATMSDEIGIEGDGTDIFVWFNGKRIAKRGDNRNWVALVPGYRVSSPPDHSTISVYVEAGINERRKRASKEEILTERSPAQPGATEGY